MSEIEQPESKLLVYCGGCNDWVHVVEGVDVEGKCEECGDKRFESRHMGTKEDE